ncbi:hypothetical protein CHU98_g3122 [Xylaria longipes]|nr:hypothetical protein CHU98_g3122 [Xylaria longipes]
MPQKQSRFSGNHSSVLAPSSLDVQRCATTTPLYLVSALPRLGPLRGSEAYSEYIVAADDRVGDEEKATIPATGHKRQHGHRGLGLKFLDTKPLTSVFRAKVGLPGPDLELIPEPMAMVATGYHGLSKASRPSVMADRVVVVASACWSASGVPFNREGNRGMEDYAVPRLVHLYTCVETSGSVVFGLDLGHEPTFTVLVEMLY